MKEPEFTAMTYDAPLHFAQTLARLNPQWLLRRARSSAVGPAGPQPDARREHG